MRVLFTAQPSPGHLQPLVPVARALAHAGHEVAVCSSASFRPHVEAFQLPYIDAGIDWLGADRSTWRVFGAVPAAGPELDRFALAIFTAFTTPAMVPDLLTIAGKWSPDLIVRESLEFGGCIAAELLGIAHASVGDATAYAAVDFRAPVAAPLAAHRARFGLPPDPEMRMLYRYLHLCFLPPRWAGDSAALPPNTHFLRPIVAAPAGEEVPDWFDQLPDRPTVLASLGTVFNRTPGVMEAIIAGLRNEPINLIVALGPDQDPSRFGPQPENVRLLGFVPQTALMPHCDLLVIHGGLNSVKDALREGVPMVVIPIAADQPYSADRCAALGVAAVVDPGRRTPEAIRGLVRTVLADSRYRASARAVQAEMMALPGPERLVELLEALPDATVATQRSSFIDKLPRRLSRVLARR